MDPSSQPLPTSVDVVVAGAGPTGLVVAIMLEQAGLDVLIVDRAGQPGTDPRASIVHVRTAELLAGLGLGPTLIEHAEPLASATYYDVGLPVADLRFDSLGSDYAALGISQVDLEHALVDRLEAIGGAVYRPVSVESVRADGVGAIVEVTRSGGEPITIESRYVIGCDGATSALRHQAGLDGSGADVPESFVVANIELSGDLDRTAMSLFASDDGFLVLSPLPDNLWRYTVTADRDAPIPTPEQLQLVLNERGPRANSLILGRPHDVGRYRVRRTIAKRLRSGGLFLAGDAAHTFSPAGSQGMNTGIADAVNLGWKLALVATGRAHDELLGTYNTERRRAARDAAERVDRFGGALSLHNPVARGLRDAIALLASRVDVLSSPVLRGLAGFDTVYTKGAVMKGKPGGRRWGSVGERLDGLMPSMLTDNAHHILVADPDEASAYRRLADSYPAPTHVEVIESGGRAGAALVRPDGHLGWTGNRGALGDLEAHLDRWLTRT